METNTRSNAMWFWGEGWSRFGIFGVLGALLIWAAHALFPEARLSIAGLAVLLMAAFGYSEWPYKRGQEDRLGDDLYYLGLTYTLASVAHALWSFTGVVDVNKLVSDFSVALLTTLVGIVGRVLLYEKYANQKNTATADEGMVRLRAEIEGAIEQMHEFRRGLALNVQQATDNAVQSASTAFASFSNNANDMSEAAKVMNASLRKGATAFDKSFGRIGEASDALGTRVGQLTEGTKALASVSEALNQQTGSLTTSLEQQSQTVWATVETHKETTRRISAELDSLNGPIVSLAHSMDEVQKQINASKQDFSLKELKTNIDSASDAADRLGRNLRSAAETLSPGSLEADFSALKVFARAITELTTKVDECTVRLTRFTEPPHQAQQALHQLAPASNDRLNTYSKGPMDSGSRTGDNGYRANGVESAMAEPSISAQLHPNPGPLPRQDNNGAEDRDSAPENKIRGWWPWRRN